MWRGMKSWWRWMWQPDSASPEHWTSKFHPGSYLRQGSREKELIHCRGTSLYASMTSPNASRAAATAAGQGGYCSLRIRGKKSHVVFLVINILNLISDRKLKVYSLQDAHLELQPIKDFYQVMHISQELMGSGDLLCILVRVIVFQERQAVHVAVAQPLAVIPVAQTLPLTWETNSLICDKCNNAFRKCRSYLSFPLTRRVPADVTGVSVWNVVFQQAHAGSMLPTQAVFALKQDFKRLPQVKGKRSFSRL